MRCLRFLLFMIGVSLCTSPLIAQTPQNRPRITSRIDEHALVTLPGNTHPYARAEFDRGPVAPDLVMSDLFLVLRRSAAQQKAFDDFVASQYDASSPNFHHWLTPDEIGTRFGPALADIQTISAWLRSHGFSVNEVSKDRMSIRFSGTATEVEAAFHAPIHNLVVRNQPHIANMSDPQIPAALAPVVLGVKALHNFFPHPLSRIGSPVRQIPDTGKWERITPSTAASPAAAVSQSQGTIARPQFGITVGSTGNTFQVEDVAPYDWAAIYNVLPLWNASTPIDGTGQKIAIAGTSNINLSDVATFRSTFGLPANVPQVVVTNSDPGTCGTTPLSSCNLDQVENTLDVEWSGAVAKNAKIILVTSYSAPNSTTDPLALSVQYIIDHSVAPVMSVSYGLCELFMGTAGNAQYSNLWKTAAGSGISVFVATGDSGAPACDQGGDAGGTPYLAEYGLSVSGLATTPDITAVGGTDFNWGSSASPYWNSSNATNGSSAKGYMPEIPWNDTCTNPLLLTNLQDLASQIKKAGLGSPTSPTDAQSACKFIADWYQTIANNTSPSENLSFLLDTVGAGGGISSCTTSDGMTVGSCSGGYAQPAWQTGVSGIPSGGKRAIPDVSFLASNGFLGSAYLICVTSAGSTCAYPTTSANGLATFLEIGGTSAATPAMAGVMALINQKAGSAQGNASPELYRLASQQTWANCNSNGSSLPAAGCYFNDITSGTIAMPCDNGLTGTKNSPDCTVKTSSDSVGVLSGYGATTAFDPATGLGSLNVANVVNHWASFVGTGSTTVTVNATPSTLNSADSLAVTGSVSGSSGAPTGTVTLTAAGYTSATPIQIDSSGNFSFTIPGYSFKSGGTVNLTARYSGDDTYAASNGTTQITVNLSAFTLSATDVTLTAGDASGSANVSTILVTPANGYTGTVTLTAQAVSGPSGAVDIPTFTSPNPVVIADSSQKHGIITVITTPAAAARTGTRRLSWLVSAGGSSLAALLLFCMPVGFRRGRRILSALLVVVAAAFTFVGCGGGGGGGGGGGTQKSTPGVTVSATANSYKTTDPIPVSISVSGGTATATGNVTLSGGGYTSSATTLSSGGANITIPAGTFAAGSVTLIATYSGDSNFNPATGTVAFTIAKPGTTPGTYTILVTGTGNDPAATVATTTFTLTVN